ncbi:MAG: cytochrome b/b6 domain-containing protein [Pseudomonadota bacterium]
MVWDWPLRLWHWLLALSLGGSWLTAELGFDYREWHMRLGYWILGLLVFRLLWGLLGSRTARFASWWPAPRALLRYLRTLLRREAQPTATAGHSPLGGLATWALLVMVAVQAGTGLFTDDDALYVGPYESAVSSAWANWLDKLHHSHFDWLLAVVGLHLTAIAFYHFYKRQRLVRPMITGRAAVPAEQAIMTPPWWRLLLAVALAAVSIWLLLELAPEPSFDDYY